MNNIADKNEIAELCNNWAFFRDQERWAELRDIFHPQGTISISWIEGPHETFVAVSELASSIGALTVKHRVDTPRVTLHQDRAIAEGNVTIMVRSSFEGVQFDTTAYARFLDLAERREGVWKLLKRTAIYEKDRMDPVGVGELPQSMVADLDAFPKEVRFLASTFRPMNVPLAAGLVTDKSPAMDQLYESASKWLAEQ